jgi:hypothetical protein
MSRVFDSRAWPDTSGPMVRKEYEYRSNAIWSLELARQATSPGDGTGPKSK